LLKIKVIQRCEFHGCLFSIMPERCPGDHPHLYSFFKHDNRFYRVREGDPFGDIFAAEFLPEFLAKIWHPSRNQNFSTLRLEGTHKELVPKAEFSIVTRANKAWMPELIAAAGPEITETYIDFFTATIRNRNTRQAYARACWQFFDWCAAHGLQLTTVRPFQID